MHACGHDVHMTCWVGAAKVLTSLKKQWAGTLLFIAQPAEERGAGARMMLADGLFDKFPVPDYGVALHVSHDQPVGTLGYTSGFAMANVDSVDVTVKGVGGHGSQPQSAKDPIVLAAQIILTRQTIVSREIHPLDPAVLTVGSIHGGSKHNIIPDDVHLQLTLRSYSSEVREHLIASIKRICRGQAEAAGVPKDRFPVVKVKDEFTPATYHDPELVKRVTGVFADWFGKSALVERKPTMGGEDFVHHRSPTLGVTALEQEHRGAALEVHANATVFELGRAQIGGVGVAEGLRQHGGYGGQGALVLTG